jgi:hypothetical protein
MKKKSEFFLSFPVFFIYNFMYLINSSILFRDFEHHITYLETNSISTNSSKMFGTFHPKHLINDQIKTKG